MIKNRITVGIVLGLGFLLSLPASATPQPLALGNAITHFEAYSEAGGRRPDHARWAAILSAMFREDARSGRGEIEYERLGAKGRRLLAGYVRRMQKVEVSSLNRNEQLAYWLNLHNAASTKFLYDEFVRLRTPARQSGAQNPWRGKRLSVKKFYLGKGNSWAQKTLSVEGVKLSLNDIEYRILYPIWKMPVVMYGLSCPARGCPALRGQPFIGDAVLGQLKLAARQFVARKDCVSVRKGRLKASELYRRHKVLFGGEQGILAHLREYASPETRAALEGVGAIHSEQFSWKLNGKAPPKQWTLPQGTFNRGAGQF